MIEIMVIIHDSDNDDPRPRHFEWSNGQVTPGRPVVGCTMYSERTSMARLLTIILIAEIIVSTLEAVLQVLNL